MLSVGFVVVGSPSSLKAVGIKSKFTGLLQAVSVRIIIPKDAKLIPHNGFIKSPVEYL